MRTGALPPIVMRSDWSGLTSTTVPYLPGLESPPPAEPAYAGPTQSPYMEDGMETVTISHKKLPWPWILAGVAVLGFLLLDGNGNRRRN